MTADEGSRDLDDRSQKADIDGAARFAEDFNATPSHSGPAVTESGAQNFEGARENDANESKPEELEPSGRRQKAKKSYARVDVPSAEQIMQEEFMNNCAVRTGLSAVMGLGLGAMFGIAMGTFDTAGAGLDGNVEVTKQTTRQVLREMFKNTSRKSWSYAKGFGAMGALFAGSECVIEKTRAKHDMYNSIYAGCFAGGALAHSAGPKGMCFGCVSFAAFSYMIDRFLDH